MQSLNYKPIIDSENRSRTLLRGKNIFKQIYKEGQKKWALLLGLGVNTKELEDLIHGYEQIFYVENENFYEYLKKNNEEILEKAQSFTKVEKEEIKEIAHKCHVYMYQQNPLLFEDFWEDILACVRHSIYTKFHTNEKSEKNPLGILIGLNINHLLAKELGKACEDLGYTPLFIDENTSQEKKELELENYHIAFFLSVNAQGLNCQFYYELKYKKVPTVLWFVDNPFHILTKFQSSWWKEIPIAVTDGAFIHPLEYEGAKKVWLLPLATHNLFYHEEDVTVDNIFFAGSYQFTAHKSFFAAVKLSPEEIEASKKENAPHFIDHWHEKGPFFLNKNLRTAGYKANISTQALRQKILVKTQDFGLTLMGDIDWNMDLEKPFNRVNLVDYYALSSWYKKAPISLALPSKLLPSALNQRHFDVWNSKGFLISFQLSDPKLPDPYSIFPTIPLLHSSLPPYIIKNPTDFDISAEFYLKNTHICSEITYLWEQILQNHTYSQRLYSILHVLTQKKP